MVYEVLDMKYSSTAKASDSGGTHKELYYALKAESTQAKVQVLKVEVAVLKAVLGKATYIHMHRGNSGQHSRHSRYLYVRAWRGWPGWPNDLLWPDRLAPKLRLQTLIWPLVGNVVEWLSPTGRDRTRSKTSYILCDYTRTSLIRTSKLRPPRSTRHSVVSLSGNITTPSPVFVEIVTSYA